MQTTPFIQTHLAQKFANHTCMLFAHTNTHMTNVPFFRIALDLCSFSFYCRIVIAIRSYTLNISINRILLFSFLIRFFFYLFQIVSIRVLVQSGRRKCM